MKSTGPICFILEILSEDSVVVVFWLFITVFTQSWRERETERERQRERQREKERERKR